MSERIHRQACIIWSLLPLGIGLAFGFFCGAAEMSPCELLTIIIVVWIVMAYRR